jgi:lysine 2,3-aminomutase
MNAEWTKFKTWQGTSLAEFENHLWQDKNAIVRVSQLQAALDGVVSSDFLSEIEAGLQRVGMSIRLNPYVMSLIDWSNAETDPIRRQFLPLCSELESDHPCLVVDSLEERGHSPVQSIVHRYPDKVLFLVTSVCPVYCQYCTRSYAIGLDTPLVQKDHVTSAQNWTAAIDYIRGRPEIEDVVISGGDIARLKPAHVRELGNALLQIEHIRRLRFATKALSVQPMKFLNDQEWLNSILEIVERGRAAFKDVCIHTHFNHPREITPLVEQAMRRLHDKGVLVRNQAVLLRGVNDNAETLRALVKGLGRINIHPYYVYLCDMVKGTEHFRLPLSVAQRLEKEVRGTTAGFNTPLFIVDTPAGKRDVHSAEFYDTRYGVSAFVSPVVAPGKRHYYFDPIRSLGQLGRTAWRMESAEDVIAKASKIPPLPPTRKAPAIRKRRVFDPIRSLDHLGRKVSRSETTKKAVASALPAPRKIASPKQRTSRKLRTSRPYVKRRAGKGLKSARKTLS